MASSLTKFIKEGIEKLDKLEASRGTLVSPQCLRLLRACLISNRVGLGGALKVHPLGRSLFSLGAS
jgi:hypothetical protein